MGMYRINFYGLAPIVSTCRVVITKTTMSNEHMVVGVHGIRDCDEAHKLLQRARALVTVNASSNRYLP